MKLGVDIFHFTKESEKKKVCHLYAIIKELGLMKAAFNVAIKEWEWLDSNPVSKVKLGKPGKGRVRFLTQAEFDRLIGNSDDWLKPLVIIARYTGLRMGNVLKLTWEQVNLFKREIIIGETKNGETIGLPVCDTLFETLKSLNKVRAIKSKDVFPAKFSYGAFQRRVQRAFKTACKVSGIENFRWHDLRHDFASMLVQRGVDIYTVQILLGHKDGRMTKRYAHLSTKNLQSAISVLDNPDFDYNLTTVGHSEE